MVLRLRFRVYGFRVKVYIGSGQTPLIGRTHIYIYIYVCICIWSQPLP